MTGLPILFALLSLGQGDPQPVRTVETMEKIGSMEIPDEIAPAIGPYITCRIMASGTPLIVDGKPVNYNLPSQTNCAKVRENAAREADKLLTQQGMSDKAKRQVFVDKVLADADNFTEALSTPQSLAIAPNAPLAPDAAPATKREP